MEPLKLKPAFQDYIWGGTKLRTEFGKECDYERIAESWELSCHPAGLSTITTSIHRGMTLQHYLEQDWAARVGEGAANFSTLGYQLGNFEFFSICFSKEFFLTFLWVLPASTSGLAATSGAASTAGTVSSRTIPASCDSTC